MTLLAIKNLLSEKVRFGVAVLGVAFSVFLIVLFIGLYRGFNDDIDDYIDSVDADLWVVQNGTRDLFGVSVMSEGIIAEVERGGGDKIESVHSLVGRPIDIEGEDGNPTKINLIGYDPEGGVGGPELIKGKLPGERGQIVIDDVLSKSSGVGLDDTLFLSERPYRVVGISRGGNFVFTQLAFLPLKEAQDALGFQVFTNYILVRLKDPGDAAAAQAEIDDATPAAQVLQRDEFLANTRYQLTRGIVPLLIVIIIVGLVVGTTVVGLTIYTLTVERIREYGIMKAVGFGNGDVFLVVIQQSLLAGVAGFGVGVVLVALAAVPLEQVLPQFSVLLEPLDLVGVFAVTLVMSLLASYVPIRRLARLDPVMVFNP